MELQYQVYGLEDISSTFLQLEQITRVLFSLTHSVQREYLKAINMELQRLKNMVYEQHNISLKVQARTYKKATYSIATKKTYTQLLLQKQYNRGNFFEVYFIPGISHAKSISRLTTTSTPKERSRDLEWFTDD